MPIVSRGVVYSLIVVVIVLLLGIVALLEVAYSRHKRLEDTTVDLERSLAQQRAKVARLRKMLADCDSLQAKTIHDTARRKSLYPKRNQ